MIKILKYITFISIAALAAEPALAQSLDPVATMLNNIVTQLTGPVGKAVAIIGIILIGFGCYMGRLNWAWFAAWLVGTTLVFFGKNIVEGFAGG